MNTDIIRLGWRGKAGLILPSANTVTEPVFYSLGPQGISFHASRTFITGTSVEDVLAMEKDKDRAVKELASTKPDCIVDCCTASGVIRGLEADRAFIEEVEKKTSIRATSTLQSIVQALRILGMDRLVITSPYPEAMDKLEESFFQKNGFRVLRVRGLNLREATQLAQVTPDEIYKFCIENWDSEANGMLISCMNFNPMPAIQALEDKLNVPVVTSNTATLWSIMRLLGVTEPIRGYGRLLSDYLKPE